MHIFYEMAMFVLDWATSIPRKYLIFQVFSLEIMKEVSFKSLNITLITFCDDHVVHIDN